jgi:hypothetical protein
MYHNGEHYDMLMSKSETIKDMSKKIKRILGLTGRIAIWQPQNLNRLQEFLKNGAQGLYGSIAKDVMSVEEVSLTLLVEVYTEKAEVL